MNPEPASGAFALGPFEDHVIEIVEYGVRRSSRIELFETAPLDVLDEWWDRALQSFDKVAEASGGPFRHREYDPAYFADTWREQLELVETEVGALEPESAHLEDIDELSDITLCGRVQKGTGSIPHNS